MEKVFPVYGTEVLGSPPAKRAKAARPHRSRQEITQAPGERKTARAEEMHAKWMARPKRKKKENLKRRRRRLHTSKNAYSSRRKWLSNVPRSRLRKTSS